ncbi:MAG: DUF1634 domain-containing protein [Candidatus Micrarchaeaceae archaeon]
MNANKSIGWILRIGAVISILLILFGMALLFINNGDSVYTLSQITSHKSQLNTEEITPTMLINGLFSLNGLSYIVLGLIVLIATPLIRVLYSVYFFGNEKNRLYVLITTIVLIDLFVAIFVIPFILNGG